MCRPAGGTSSISAGDHLINPGYYAVSWSEQAYKDGLIPSYGTVAGKPLFCSGKTVGRALAALMFIIARNLGMP